MDRRVLTLIGVAFCSISICHAKKINTSQAQSEMDRFVNSITEDFENFRKQSMMQFAEFVKNPWKEFSEKPAVPRPEPEPIPPVINEESTPAPPHDNPILIDEVVEPVKDEPQPQPIEPIEEVPVISPTYLDFEFFGTRDQVRFEKTSLPSLSGIDEASVASMLKELASDVNDNLIIDCLDIRKNRELSDWAYIQMLNKIADKIYPENKNEAQLLLAYLYMQSGYRMRLGIDGSNLYMLFGSRHQIYEKPFYSVDGENYYGLQELPNHMKICQASFPEEKSLSLAVTTNQKFTLDSSDNRTITSARYPEVKLNVKVNKNLLDFYSTYPASCINENMMTRWAMYAENPMDHYVSELLYPTLKEVIIGKTEHEAVSILLNTLQTGMEYEYDTKVWGHDRAFFPEETLFYPYCDCEDRAILLTRLVRDILGLNCLLVYYPGHLASAIEFTDDAVSGDYIILDGHKYIIADPTYINAPVGDTMPGMDNASAKVILLKRMGAS